MRYFSFGLFALVLLHPIRETTIDPDRAVPRFILHHGEWICVDKNPRQLNRQDCAPRGQQRAVSQPE
jgi:hypothetical protein